MDFMSRSVVSLTVTSDKPSFEASVRVNNFICTLSGQVGDWKKFAPSIRGTRLKCELVDPQEHLLWDCELKGTIGIGSYDEADRIHERMWSGSFNSFNRNLNPPQLKPLCVTDQEQPEEYVFTKPRPLEGRRAYLETKVDIIIDLLSYKIVDLTLRSNELITGPHDAAPFDICGVKVWLSKDVLSVHSPLFATTFEEGPGEDGFYTLHDPLCLTDFYTFKHFLATMHNYSNVVNLKSYIYLLDVATTFDCYYVSKQCEDFVRMHPWIDDSTKLYVAGKYGLLQLASEVIERLPGVNLYSFLLQRDAKVLSPKACGPVLDMVMQQINSMSVVYYDTEDESEM
ncbi:hypothetical protein L596_024111 [Steinernema carpocapsae]|uniref:BTB domain-containing protein n=1 Tax=Steinernema carpocapsae TaxID=34508 RepID=A0A4U5MFS0_STECR|nr:hypothetical protein L596_024111 [Steinernema carpocapsae]